MAPPPVDNDLTKHGVASLIEVLSEDPIKKEDKDKEGIEKNKKVSNDEALANAKAELKAEKDELVSNITL